MVVRNHKARQQTERHTGTHNGMENVTEVLRFWLVMGRLNNAALEY